MFLSELVFYRTYSKTLETGKKETWPETVDRVFTFFADTFIEHINNDAEFKQNFLDAKQAVLDKNILPSMRLLQFAGDATKRENARLYNCTGLIIKTAQDFADACYLSLCGCGVGVGIPKPIKIKSLKGNANYIIPDSREGWSEAIKYAICSPFCKFDYSLVRPKGAIISTGGTASGAEPLQKCIENIQKITQAKKVVKNSITLEIHDIADIVCYFLEAIMVGGTRRSAGIAIMPYQQALTYKENNFWETNPQRYLINVSAYQANAFSIYKNIFTQAFHTGEPGIVKYSPDSKYITNPCGEISGEDKFFCNLTTINAPKILKENAQNISVFWRYAELATFLGTLQAYFIDFHYIQPKWTTQAAKNRLLGVSITGIQECYLELKQCLLERQTKKLIDINKKTAKLLGIHSAKRIGCIKPEGTTSAFLETTSGIHNFESPYYYRHVMIENNNPIVIAMLKHEFFKAYCSPSVYNSNLACIKIPMINHITKFETLALIRRAATITKLWIAPLHISGEYANSVSITVPLQKQPSKQLIRELIPLGNATVMQPNNIIYKQAPFQWLYFKRDEDKKAFFEEHKEFHAQVFDWAGLDWSATIDNRKDISACSGNSCDI
jgi:ribonucleoside-diphosphate reductase alpha chain